MDTPFITRNTHWSPSRVRKARIKFVPYSVNEWILIAGIKRVCIAERAVSNNATQDTARGIEFQRCINEIRAATRAVEYAGDAAGSRTVGCLPHENLAFPSRPRAPRLKLPPGMPALRLRTVSNNALALETFFYLFMLFILPRRF